MVRREMFWLWAPLLVIVEVTAHYTPQWAAHIEGGPEMARRVVEGHGFTLLAEIFPDTYHLVHSRVAKRSASPSRYHNDRLTSDKQVVWARQLRVIRRVKRDLLTRRELGLPAENVFPNDPKWQQMWYLNRGAGLDMSVEGAWREGVTGKGIVVTILDDGLEKDHPDLMENYDPMASYDVNGHDDNPMPRYDMIDSNRHGTRCAGEVAAVANNSLCSLGIAYHASVGGVRMLDGDVTDAVEARSLSLNPQHIDIYSASWGPDDDGKTVDGPGELATRAFINGVNKGRGGKGSIFVWASGNGGRDHDNCNCDGYTNSIWTLSISSATENGLVPWYSEACSSTLATTYSSGSTGEKQIVTTDLHHQCTTSHTGTSASAPLAAGICALALEANTDLTWRDMQHIVVATAKPANLKSTDWVTNGVGRNVSHSFGYGLMDAAAMVRLARSWVTVPTQQKCEVSAPHVDKAIPAKSYVTLQLTVKECPGVRYLEHVQAKITLMTQRRGDIEIHLTSPAGTKTMLLAKRPHDVSRTGFRNWPFMSVHTWGENPIGKWSLEIHNEARFLGRASLQGWALILYGTDNAPQSFNQAYVPSIPPPTAAPKKSSTLPPPALPGPPSKKVKGQRKNKGTNPTPKTPKKKKLFDPVPLTTAFPSPSRKTPRPSVIQARRPTMPPPVFHPVDVGLTILLAPPQGQETSNASHRFPDIFLKYPHAQQLIPYSKINEPPLRPSKKGLVQSEPQRETAQLSEWNLIFYGTETAPGAAPDPVDSKPKPGADAGAGAHFGGDNALDAPSGGGKWRDVTQRTGATSENVDLPSRDNLSSGCAKPSDACLECFDGWSLSNGQCVKTDDALAMKMALGCPSGEYRTGEECSKCHYTCKKCSGPSDYECTQCYADAVVYSTTGENFCFPKSLLPSVNYTMWLRRVYLGLLLNVLFLVSAGIVMYVRERGCRMKKAKVTPKVLESIHYKLAADNSDSDN